MKHYLNLFLLTLGLLCLGSPTAAENRDDLQALVDQIRQVGAQFYAGTYPGYNDVQKVTAYQKALSDATYALERGDNSANYTALFNALYDAYTEVSNSGFIPMTDGYYFFVNAWPLFEERSGSRKAMVDADAGSFAWENFNPRELKQVWKVTSTGDGTFSIQNVATGYYVAFTNGETYLTMSETHTTNQVFTHIDGSQQWNIANVDNPAAYHTGGHGSGWGESGPIVAWNTGANDASAWYVVPITDLQLAHLKNGDASQAYNDLVSAIYACNNHVYLGGSSIGYHDITKVNAYYTALQAAKDGLAMMKEDVEYQALSDALMSATATADASLIMPGNGYFYFVNAWPAFEQLQGVRKALTQTGPDALSWDTWNEKDARQLWYVVPLDDGTYSVQNVVTKKFMGGASALGGPVPMTDAQMVGQIFRHLDGYNQFNLISTAFDIAYHPGGHDYGAGVSGPIVTWWGGGNDASAWFIMEVTDEDLLNEIINGKSEAYRALEATVGAIETANPQFTAGTAPGYYNSRKINAFERALEDAKAALNQSLSDAEYTALNNKLTQAYADAKNSLIPVTDGYYYFINAWPAFENCQGVKKAMSASFDHQLTWGTYAERNPQQVWHVTTISEGRYSVQNVGTGEYIGGVEGLGQLLPMTATQKVQQSFRHLEGSTQFNICNEINDIAYHPGGHDNGYGDSGPACTWWGGAYDASAWYIEPITDATEIDYIVNQLAAKQKLTTLVNNPPFYQTGTDPGYYGADEVDALMQVLAEVGTKLSNPAADYGALVAQVDAALAAVDASRVAVSNGYYYFVNAWPAFESIQGERMAMRAEHGSNALGWTMYDPEDSQELFKVTCLDDDTYTIQNVATGLYINAFDGDAGYVTMTESPVTPQVLVTLGSEPQFKMANTGNPTGYHPGSHDMGAGSGGTIILWNTGANEASAWYIMALTDEDMLEEILGVGVAQGKLEDLIAKVTDYVDHFAAGEEYGDVTSDQWAAMQAAITNAESYNHSNPQKADLEQRYTQLEAALATFMSQQKQCEPNKWYYIVSQDRSRTGSFKDGVGNNDIYATFVYGNVIYATSDNTDAAGSWGEGNKNAIHWGYFKRASADPEDLSGEALYRENCDPHAMWRLVPIEGQEGQYALQNRASGKYLKSYAANAPAWLRQVNTPGAYVLELFASGQYGIRPPEATKFIQLSGDGYLHPNSTADRANTAWAFNLEPVEADLMKLQVPENSIQIISLPYALDDEDIATINVSNDVITYAIMGKRAGESSAELCLKEQSTFAAGEPFILVAGDYTAYDPESKALVSFAVPVCDTFKQEGQTKNGLVAVLDYMKAPSAGLGIFANGKMQATTEGQGIDAHTGYINMSLVPTATGTPDLVIKVPDTIDGIVTTINDKPSTMIYNLAGQRLAKPQRGINIVNGKKIIVR